MVTKRLTGNKKKIAKNNIYVCETCGLKLKVAEPCCCSENHDIFCCGQPTKSVINESGNA